MKSCVMGWVVVVSMLVAGRVEGKAAFAGKEEMIKRSAAIAVVEVTGVEKVAVKGGHWTYGQRATARVETVLKGELGKVVVMHGGEDFICARCTFGPGRYLVFLRRDGGLWVGSNWHLSVRPVVKDAQGNEVVEWYAGERGIELKARAVEEVVGEVRGMVE